MEDGPKSRRRVHPGGIALGAGLLVAGAAIGFGIRTARLPDSAESEPLRKVSPPRLETQPQEPPATEPEPPERTTEALSLSDHQWSEVLADPARFALNIFNIRRSADPGWRLEWVERIGGLLGWDQPTMDRVDEAVRGFDEKLGRLEAGAAEVTRLPGDEFGHNIFRISYAPLAGRTEELLEELWQDLSETIGERDLERLMAISDPSAILEERGEGAAEVVNVLVSYNGFRIEVLQRTDRHGPRGTYVSSIQGEGAADRAAAVVTPAIDWAGLLQEQEELFRSISQDLLTPLPEP